MASDPRKSLGYAVIILCFAGFAGLLWEPLCDAWDLYYPTRTVVASRANPDVRVRVDYSAAGREVRSVRAALDVLPAGVVRAFQRFGGEFAVVEQEALAHIQLRDVELSHVVGLYVPEQKKALISFDTQHPGRTALHEAGHMLDYALDQASGREPFTAIYDQARRDRPPGAQWRDIPGEYFAEFFNRYYYSDRHREWLRQRFPDGHAYFARLESCLEQRQASACK